MQEKALQKNLLLQNPITNYIKKNIGIIAALLIISTILSILEPIFLTKANLTNVSRQIVTNLLLSYGMTMALLIGAIDLAVGSVVAASGCIFITAIFSLINYLHCLWSINWCLQCLDFKRYKSSAFYCHLGNAKNRSRRRLYCYKWKPCTIN